MNVLYTKYMTPAAAETIELLWNRMTREQRVRALKNISGLPQRPGSTESLLATARRQSYENGEESFLPTLSYSCDLVGDYRRLRKNGTHAQATFAGLWLAAHRHDDNRVRIWHVITDYLHPFWAYGSKREYQKAVVAVLRAVREARA